MNSKLTPSESLMLLFFAFPVTIWNAFVVTKLYNWFVVNQFDVNQLHIVTAIGIIYLVSLFKTHGTVESFEHGIELVVTSAVYGLITLGFGFIVTLFL